mgnify:CR=1 FL=1
MPKIYLSPSTQEGNQYVTGSGSEERNMNLLADAMVPYLVSNGIQYTRNTPDMTAGSSIRQANQGYYDFYLALHSNGAAPQNYGQVRGVIAFYYPTSTMGREAAEIFANNLKVIYPEPSLVRTQSTTTLGEVRLSKAPAVLLELGYHDNVLDAQWVENNTSAIAQNLVLSLTELFDLPFIWPIDPIQGQVNVDFGTLNLRSRPSPTASVIANMRDGAMVTIYGRWQGWYVVHYGQQVGYAAARFIQT